MKIWVYVGSLFTLDKLRKYYIQRILLCSSKNVSSTSHLLSLPLLNGDLSASKAEVSHLAAPRDCFRLHAWKTSSFRLGK